MTTDTVSRPAVLGLLFDESKTRQEVTVAISALPATDPQLAIAEMLDRILESAKTLTRPLLVDWLERERACLPATDTAECERLRAALAFYAAPENWSASGVFLGTQDNGMWCDTGDHARTTLKDQGNG